MRVTAEAGAFADPRFSRSALTALGALGLIVGCVGRMAGPVYGGPPTVPFKETITGDVEHEIEQMRANALARGCRVKELPTGLDILCDGNLIAIRRLTDGMSIECSSARRCEPIVKALRAPDAGVPTDAGTAAP